MAQQTGERLRAGRYRVVERLGSGGMAAVYLAEDERLGRRVAVKSLHADSPEETARRFEREAKLLASLNHPNIVSVFDTVAAAEGVLIVMEYVEGETLGAALGRGPLEPGRAAAVIRDVAAALDHAHGHGVVHRDVKPGNVLLGRGDVVKLADLGIATVAEGTQITHTGTVLGTPSYMAPEQLDGGELGPAVDVYALAAVAFEALSGHKARTGRTPLEIARRVATEAPPDLREAWPRAPRGAAAVLRRGMARDPRARPASAGELAAELTAALEQRRESTAATVPLAAAPRRARRAAAWVPLALLVGLVAAVLALATQDETRNRGGGAALPGRGGPSPADANRAERRPRAEQPAADAPAAPADPVAEGLRLQEAGFADLGAGRYRQAIDASRRAADLLAGSGRIEYAYALFNLGRALRLAGRPAEAVPVLEQRLGIPNQRGQVEQELALARRDAGLAPAAGRGDHGKGGKGKGRGGGDENGD